MSENLIQELQRQLKRRRELLTHYEAIGPIGRFGHTMISADITDAEEAMASGDTVRMIHAYTALEGCK